MYSAQEKDKELQGYLENARQEGEALTKWANEPSVRQLKRDFEQARNSHQAQMSKIERWNDLLYVRNQAKPKKLKGRSGVQPKLIRRQAEWRYSALTEPFLNTDKVFQIKPKTFEDVEGARQNELLINWQFKTQIDLVKLMDDYVRSTVDDGTSIIKVGWCRYTVKEKVEVPVYEYHEITPIENPEEVQRLQVGLQMRKENRRQYEEKVPEEIKASVEYFLEKEIPTVAIETGTKEIERETIIDNRPTIDIYSPENVYPDPSCEGDLDKANFLVLSFETSQAELKKNEIYKNLDKVIWQDAGPLTDPDHDTATPGDFQFPDSLRRKIIAYEYWGFYDIHNEGKLVPIVATWIGNVMIRMEENPFPDNKIPFIMVPYLPVKRELWGETDAELLEDNQRIQGAITRGMIDLLGRSANAQTGMAKGALDALNKRRYENGEDYEFNPNIDPTRAQIQHKFPELSESALQMSLIQNQEAEALTGVKSFSGGITSEAYGSVATGMRGAIDAAAKREMAIMRRMSNGMAKVARKIVSMNSVFLSEEEVVRVTNSEFVTIRKEDLKGSFDYVVDISTAEMDNVKANDLGFMLQTIGPGSHPQISTMILAEIADLKRMPHLAQALRVFKPEPNPLEEAYKQAEIEGMKAEAAENQASAQLKLAQAKEAEAKARLTDLEYVEQETGTNHARDIEKQKAQSRGNQDLEITKSFLKPRRYNETEPDVPAAVGYRQLSKKDGESRPNGNVRPPVAPMGPGAPLAPTYSPDDPFQSITGPDLYDINPQQ